MAQCTYDLIDPVSIEVNQKLGMPVDCQSAAKIKIDGKLLCQRHANIEAFRILQSEGRVQKVGG